MHPKYQKGREGGGARGDIFVFVLTKTKIIVKYSEWFNTRLSYAVCVENIEKKTFYCHYFLE